MAARSTPVSAHCLVQTARRCGILFREHCVEQALGYRSRVQKKCGLLDRENCVKTDCARLQEARSFKAGRDFHEGIACGEVDSEESKALIAGMRLWREGK